MMSHRLVGIDAKYTHHHFQILKNTINQAINPSLGRPAIHRKVIVYMAARTKVKSMSEKLGNYLDTTPNLHNQDVVTLVSTMTKEEKAFYTHLFLKDDYSDKYNPHILCATSGVGNAGIDSSKIGIIYRLGMPESVCDFFQEKGRASWYPNALASENRYLVCFTIEDLIYLFKRTMDPKETVLNEQRHEGQVSDLLQLVKVLASDQCMSVHIETILGNPEMRADIPEVCGECPVCKNDHIFFQINRQGTKTVLLDLFVFGNHPIEGKPDLKSLVKAIKTYPGARWMIISGTRLHSEIQPIEIKKVLFMLVAHSILVLESEHSSNTVIFCLAKSNHNNSILALQHDPYWIAMNLLVNLDG